MTEDEILQLLTNGEADLQAAFKEVIAYLRETNELPALEYAIRQGRIDDALKYVDTAAAKITERIENVYTQAALETASAVSQEVGQLISYHASNPAAVEALQTMRRDFIVGFTQEQRQVTHNVIMGGLERGDNPRKIARELRESIGLTPYQEQIISNYRDQLERGQLWEAASRQLHDDRFNRAIDAAERRGDMTSLSSEQIQRMVDRYRQNWINYRAEVIARTETLRAVHEGSQQLYLQAIDAGDLDPKELECTWHAGSPPRTREWHATMNGQKRDWDEPFTSGQGTPLMYPGDPDAPSDEVCNCRCARSVRVVRA